jgi:hypothetical protein
LRYRWCEVCATLYLDGEVHECARLNARPNWRDLAEYPDPRFPKPNQLAWEFLRQNPNYRADWARYSALPERIKGGPGSALAEKYGINRMADPGDAKAWPSLTRNVDRMRFISQHTRKADYPASVAPGEIWLKFNLTLPIKANMKRTKRALERFQENVPRARDRQQAGSLRQVPHLPTDPRCRGGRRKS